MIRLIFGVFLIFLICGCNQKDLGGRSSNDKVRLANEISYQVAKKLEKERGLIPFGSGGQMMNRIEMLHLGFRYNKPLDVNESRELILAAMNALVDAVNAEPKIHQYLAQYPFAPENIEVEIFIQDNRGEPITSSVVGIASCRKGKCIYEKRDKGKFETYLVSKETVAEAEQKIKDYAP